ncbi:MAG: transketolase [Chthonomonadaceae bacterium]|nr:transketolase [Chthonomonadaceae bacterium]
MDAVQKAKSGHPGMPMGAAAMAFALWTRHLRHAPNQPSWIDRDRFVLSAGHGSMLLYSLLYLTGYGMTLEDLEEFRQWDSKTPGHPENGLTPGVEMATGPLGQGLSTAVGMALAEAWLSAKYNRPGHSVVDHRTFVIASDGDLMEGVTQEASSLAGHWGLGKLIVLYDDNQITIDGSTSLAFSEDVEARYRALGWGVWRCDGMSIEAVDKCLQLALDDVDKPSLIMCRTTIGFGSPNKAGKSSSHGSPLGAEEVLIAKAALGMPDTEFWVDSEALKEYRKAVDLGKELTDGWEARVLAYEQEFPELAKEFKQAVTGELGTQWHQGLQSFQEAGATRDQSHAIIGNLANTIPNLLSGCADLAESVKTLIPGEQAFSRSAPTGRNIAYGIREHAMAAIVNGMTLHGGLKPFGGTFLVFSDYCKPSLRLAALMHCPSIFLFSHDSIGLGEDGPTHQPVEHLFSLRAVPNFNVMRPADGNELASCWKIALESKTSPSAIVLSRQKLPILTPSLPTKHPAEKGAYVLREASGNQPKVVLIATGSEVSLAVAASEKLEAEGTPTRVVSMPSCFLFDRQPDSYRRSVLPAEILSVSIEAGSTCGWHKYADVCIGLDRFGASAPAETLFDKFGFTVDNVVDVVCRALSSN